MANNRLKKLMLEAVGNQLKDPKTVYVKDAYEKMKEAGYTAKEAKEAIAGVLLSEMYTILGEMTEFDDERYQKGLEEMLEDYGLLEEEEPWPGMNELLEEGEDALNEDFSNPDSIIPWEQAWKIVQDKVKQAEMPMEIYEVDEATDYIYDLEEWIIEMMYSYRRKGEENRCIRFCKEVLDTFAWEQVSPSMVKRCIGECLFELGRIYEGDQWHEIWLKEGWDADAAIAGAFYWMAREDYQKAEEILDRILKESEGTEEYDGFYRTAAILYRKIGKEEKAKAFDRMEEEYIERMKEAEDEFADWELPFFSDGEESQEPVVKPKKIYPNDPCPCGSGKKYKKCCGKK